MGLFKTMTAALPPDIQQLLLDIIVARGEAEPGTLALYLPQAQSWSVNLAHHPYRQLRALKKTNTQTLILTHPGNSQRSITLPPLSEYPPSLLRLVIAKAGLPADFS